MYCVNKKQYFLLLSPFDVLRAFGLLAARLPRCLIESTNVSLFSCHK